MREAEGLLYLVLSITNLIIVFKFSADKQSTSLFVPVPDGLLPGTMSFLLLGCSPPKEDSDDWGSNQHTALCTRHGCGCGGH